MNWNCTLVESIMYFTRIRVLWKITPWEIQFLQQFSEKLTLNLLFMHIYCMSYTCMYECVNIHTLNLKFNGCCFYLYFSVSNSRLILKKIYALNLILKNSSATLLWICHIIIRINYYTRNIDIRYMGSLNRADLKLIIFERLIFFSLA